MTSGRHILAATCEKESPRVGLRRMVALSRPGVFASAPTGRERGAFPYAYPWGWCRGWRSL